MQHIRQKTKLPDEPTPERIRLTAHLTLDAYDAITELQRQHRRKTGRSLPLWKLLDAAVTAYAKEQGINAKG